MMYQLPYPPVEGKTYTLFGETGSTKGYFSLIGSLADAVLARYDPLTIIDAIRRYAAGKGFPAVLAGRRKPGPVIDFCLDTIHEPLKPYTRRTAEHLERLPWSKKLRDRRLSTTESQYHLCMLEIALTNRMNRERFLACDRKISLQPYCLQDFSVDCKAARGDFDVECKNCSKNCYQGMASRILRRAGIESYIWMGAGIRKAARETIGRGQSLGILGIACIPELAEGMRKCGKYGIPVVGLPLNANRCIRWFGEFLPNSVDLHELERLVDLGSHPPNP